MLCFPIFLIYPRGAQKKIFFNVPLIIDDYNFKIQNFSSLSYIFSYFLEISSIQIV